MSLFYSNSYLKPNASRIKEHPKYLMGKGKNVDLPKMSVEKLEEIHKKTLEKEELDKASISRLNL